MNNFKKRLDKIENQISSERFNPPKYPIYDLMVEWYPDKDPKDFLFYKKFKTIADYIIYIYNEEEKLRRY